MFGLSRWDTPWHVVLVLNIIPCNLSFRTQEAKYSPYGKIKGALGLSLQLTECAFSLETTDQDYVDADDRLMMLQLLCWMRLCITIWLLTCNVKKLPRKPACQLCCCFYLPAWACTQWISPVKKGKKKKKKETCLVCCTGVDNQKKEGKFKSKSWKRRRLCFS